MDAETEKLLERADDVEVLNVYTAIYGGEREIACGDDAEVQESLADEDFSELKVIGKVVVYALQGTSTENETVLRKVSSMIERKAHFREKP